MHIPSISYTNPPPMSMTTLISKLLPLFVTSDKGVNTSSRHLIITRQANIIFLISIITAGAIITLITLIAKSVKTSVHAHKLCHDGLKCHSTR